MVKIPDLTKLLVSPGDPIQAKLWNQLVAAAAQGVISSRGMGEGEDRDLTRLKFPDKILAVNRDIPAYSLVVPVNDNALTVELQDDFVIQDVDYYTTTPVESTLDGYFMSNGPDPVAQGEYVRTVPILDFIPTLLTYTGDAPAYGDELAPTDSSFALTKTTGGEFKCVAPPNTNEKLVWVARIRTLAPVEIGKLESSIATGTKATVFRRYILSSGTSPTSAGESLVEVLNITGTTLQPGIFHYKFSVKDFYIDIVWPEEIEECLTPLVQVQTGAV